MMVVMLNVYFAFLNNIMNKICQSWAFNESKCRRKSLWYSYSVAIRISKLKEIFRDKQNTLQSNPREISLRARCAHQAALFPINIQVFFCSYRLFYLF